MHFAPDTEDTLEFAVSLCNTDPGASKTGTDEIATPEELTALLKRHSYGGRFDRDETERLEVIATRDLLRTIWSLPTDDAAIEINRLLEKARALPYLTRHDHWDWHLHATPLDAPLAERIEVEVGLALVDVIRSRETDRLRVCEADDCTGLLVDLSRNGSKRFCSVRCGNRVNMIAFRERAAN